MLVQIFGLLDILGGIALLLSKLGADYHIFYILGLIIITKSLIFFNAISFVDVLAGLFLIFTPLVGFGFFTWILIIWLLQKGCFSLFS